jgi:hypothetical protein
MPPAMCLDDRRSRFPTAISCLRSARRSRSFGRKTSPCKRSLAGSGGQHRRSLGSYGATPPPEAAASSIVRRQRNGTPSRRAIRALSQVQSLRSTWHGKPTWRDDWLAWSSLQAGFACRGRPYLGRVVGTGDDSPGGGPGRGAQSRSLATWFEHYNALHPHRSLGYRSPWEFIALKATSTGEVPLSGN